ncbi:MAG: MBL fold metallo-hydrolase [Xanthomonadales bacterium]|nr:MBL fold metallo-hydrolase [Xanthomonadales bacterium]
MKIWSIEGNQQKLDGGAMFGNAPKAVWERWIKPDARNRISIPTRTMLVEDLNGKTVLFETGIGAFFEPSLRDRFGVESSEHVLLNNLLELGIKDEDIDVVVLSHLHFDHAGGLLSAWQKGRDYELLFPNAHYLVGKTHWQRATHPHPRDAASFIPELSHLLEQSGRLELVDDRQHPLLGDSVRFSFSDGHTPGLMLAEIGPAIGGGIVFCADLIPGRAWIHTSISMGYDRYPELLLNEKKTFLEDKLARNVRLFFTHDNECALVTVRKDDRGRFVSSEELAILAGLQL